MRIIFLLMTLLMTGCSDDGTCVYPRNPSTAEDKHIPTASIPEPETWALFLVGMEILMRKGRNERLTNGK